jgi:MYXO-CTERM domain-containing protein
MGEPACPGAAGPAPHGFTTHNRFIRGKAQAYVGPAGCEGIRYHGLDYMLLHNLYAIATPGTWNGPADADPCAVTADGAALIDAGIAPPEADILTHGSGGGGCGCDTRDEAPAWPLIVIVIACVLRRRV